MARLPARRLVDIYAVGDRVEILLADEEIEVWQAGEVVAHQFPAVWVRTDGDRKVWFVTNGKRIRKVSGLRKGES